MCVVHVRRGRVDHGWTSGTVAQCDGVEIDWCRPRAVILCAGWWHHHECRKQGQCGSQRRAVFRELVFHIVSRCFHLTLLILTLFLAICASGLTFARPARQSNPAGISHFTFESPELSL